MMDIVPEDSAVDVELLTWLLQGGGGAGGSSGDSDNDDECVDHDYSIPRFDSIVKAYSESLSDECDGRRRLDERRQGDGDLMIDDSGSSSSSSFGRGTRNPSRASAASAHILRHVGVKSHIWTSGVSAAAAARSGASSCSGCTRIDWANNGLSSPATSSSGTPTWRAREDVPATNIVSNMRLQAVWRGLLRCLHRES